MKDQHKTDVREDQSSASDIAINASLIIAGRWFGAVSRIFAIIILARLLDKSDFGLVSFALLTYLTIQMLSQLGLPESVFYFFEKYPRESRRDLVLYFGRTLFGVATISALLFVVIGWIASSRGYDVLGLFVPLTLLILLELPSMPIGNVLIAQGHARAATKLHILFSIILFLAMVLPPTLGQPKEWIMYALVGYGAIKLVVSSVCLFRFVGRSTVALPPGLARSILTYSIPLAVAQITWRLNQFVDKYVVMYFLPVTVFAEYAVGSWEIPFVPAIATSVAAVMMPQMITRHLNGEIDTLLDFWCRSIKKVALMVLPLMILLVLVSRELIVVLFSEDYINASLVFCIYSLVLFQRVADYTYLLKAMNETSIVTKWAAYSLVINVVLSVPFVLWLGMEGAALATLVAAILAWGYVLSRISNLLKTSIRNVFPFAFYVRVLLVSIAATIPAILLTGDGEGAYGTLLAWKAAVYLAAYIGLGSVFGLFARTDWLFLARLLGLPQRAGP